MVKKKVSGQAIAIIVLIVMLIATIAFGGVYAFYSASSGRVSSSGVIMMASLDIDFKEDKIEVGVSAESQILITNMNNHLVPNELLGNSPLTVVNNSVGDDGQVVPIYLVVLYRVQKATADNNDRHLDDIYRTKIVKDQETGKDKKEFILDANGNKIPFGVIDIGTSQEDSPWADFIFDTNNYPEYAEDAIETNDNYVVRCFVSKAAQTTREIEVIKKNNLRLHEEMTNDFQGQSISFTFQAHAIVADQETFNFTDATTQEEKSTAIVKAIYESNAWYFAI